MAANNSAFDDASHGIFTRIGECNKVVTAINTFRGTTIPALGTTLNGLFVDSDQTVANGLFDAISSSTSGLDTLAGQCQKMAQNSLLAVYGRNGAPDNSLLSSLKWLISYMGASTDTVKANTVSCSKSAGSGNSGTGVLSVTPYRYDGRYQEFSLAETITGTITSDSQSGGTAVGSEVLTLVGQAFNGNPFSAAWPDGSGISVKLTAVNPTATPNGGTGNWLTNGTFETWSAPNVPQGWTIDVGSPGSTVTQNTTYFADGVSSLAFTGDGSSHLSISQALTTGTTGSKVVQPLTQYMANVFVYAHTSAPTGGVLRLALVDGSGTVIQDAAGNNNQVTLTLNTVVANTWTPLTAVFRTPRVLPSAVYLRLSTTTAQVNTEVLYIDRAAFTQPTMLYDGGPSVAFFSGPTASKVITGDTFAITVSNNLAGVLHTAMDRFFGLRASNLLLPTSGSPTISDSLG